MEYVALYNISYLRLCQGISLTQWNLSKPEIEFKKNLVLSENRSVTDNSEFINASDKLYIYIYI
jgi:hypothetical protein